MARLALAAIFVLVLAGLAAVLAAGLYRLRRENSGSDLVTATEGAVMQKMAFVLLVALILYVSVSGGA